MKDYKSPENTSKKSELKHLSNFAYYLKPYKKQVFFLIITLFLSTSAVLGFGSGFKIMIDKGLQSGDSAALDKWIIIITLLIVLMASAIYFRIRLLAVIGENIASDLRASAFAKLVHLSPEYYDKNKASEVTSTLTTDISTLLIVITGALPIFARNILLLIGGITLLITTSPSLSATLLLLVPLTIIPIIWLGKRLRKKSQETQTKIAELSGHLSETLEAIKFVQSVCNENTEINNFKIQSKEVVNVSVDQVNLRAILTASVVTLVFGAIAYLLHIGGTQVISGKLSAGELASFVFYAILVAGSFGALSEIMGDIQRAAGASENLKKIFNEISAVNENANAQTLPENIAGNVVFQNVTFCYPTRAGGSNALDGFNLSVAAGNKAAIIGSSGAGKSTIIQLLLRLYDPNSGKILIDGYDIKNLKFDSFRKKIFWMSQEPVIFSGSFKENITYLNPKATQEQISNAIEKAACGDILKKMPEGLNTVLGTRGSQLSGGERQRIALARAFLQNPSILLLDEATSALDSVNERLIQNSLEELMKGRTSIIIAHRLSTIRNADQIIIVKNGKSSETGSHEELLEKSNDYRKMVELQNLE